MKGRNREEGGGGVTGIESGKREKQNWKKQIWKKQKQKE